jgi:hypothetical protein
MRNRLLLALSIACILVGCKAVDAMNNTDVMKKDLAAMKETTGGAKFPEIGPPDFLIEDHL